MTLTKFDAGLCIHIDEGKSFILNSFGTLEMTEFDEGGIYASVKMEVPNWLKSAIAKAFEEKVAEEMHKSA